MSSTAEQIDAANKLKARVEAGEQVAPIVNSGGAAASALTTQTPQQPGIEIAEDATMGGLNRENMKIVEVNEAVPVIGDRVIAPVVGKGQQQPLAKQFVNPTVRAEDQCALDDEQISSAQANTVVPPLQLKAAENMAKINSTSVTTKDVDAVSSAKNTKVPNAQAHSGVAKALKAEWDGGDSGADASADYDASGDYADAGDSGEGNTDGTAADTTDSNATSADSTETTTTTVVETGDANAGESTIASDNVDAGTDAAVTDAPATDATAGDNSAYLATKTTTTTK